LSATLTSVSYPTSSIPPLTPVKPAASAPATRRNLASGGNGAA
jgi:hypothetical protein